MAWAQAGSLQGPGGVEAGYAERLSTWTTTNTTGGNAAGKISGVEVTVIGQGRPVAIEFYCGAVKHSAAGAVVVANIALGGNTGSPLSEGGAAYCPVANTSTSSLYVARRGVLTDGVSYTFAPIVYASIAGTTTLIATGFYPIWLAVTTR